MTGPAQTADQRDEEQRREWNTYVAKVPVNFYGTRAYNPGDKVPLSAVEGEHAWVHTDWVDRIGEDSTPNAGSQTAPPPGPPAIDTTVTAAPPASSPAPPPDPSPAAGGDPSPDTGAARQDDSPPAPAAPGADTPTES